jgi:hypothetical protein
MSKYFLFIIIILIIFINPILFAQDTEQNTSSIDSPKKNPWDAITSGKLIKHIRSYYMNRHFDEPLTQESFALGGWLGYETAAWYGLSATVLGYTSQGLGLNDKDKSGAGLLGDEQDGITVLGQAYGQLKTENILIRLYRQALDTPFINGDDYRMVPYLYEAYTLQTTLIKKVQIFVSQITKIKGWTDTAFRSMSEFAGISDSNDGVTAAGAVYNPKDNLTIQAWNYYCYNFMNAAFAQIDYDWKFTDKVDLQLSAQGFYQANAGDALYGDFHTSLGGAQATLNWYGLKPKLGFTITDKSHDIVNPWSAWLGYTSIMEEDCDLAGEKAWIVGITYDLSNIGIKGFSVDLEHTRAYIPPRDWFSTDDQRETNLTIDYAFSGKLNGLALRLRAASVHYSFDTNLESYTDYRAILNYDF